MRYVNALDILPKELLEELQQYVQGDLIYIPKPGNKRTKWGVLSGERKRLQERNEQIKKLYKEGKSIQTLAEQHHLSVETIKKIIYRK
ncbi:CD3324 family protein [Lysinibacillus sp. BW-2-10]|uniref:CD3324 family protein n=1 Tax=Lysinibacillus sp. BW-2-10 TaxID=2590030 RepID=UPI00117FF814|nr:CD3324 family protein [Lysinibacillus sp. BW-2-10]TSI06199.1 helix-turn-helix domain-containing protein [Lysinibacillus sp. BW-2-10]